MARKRRRFTAEFKARVALEALRERDSVQAIAARHELHPNQVTTWKRQLLEGLPEVFRGRGPEARQGARGEGPGPAREDRGAHGRAGFFSARAQALSRAERVRMIERDGPLSLSRQCALLGVSRSSRYYRPRGESAENLALMRRMDELHMAYPFYGSRQLVRHLRREGVAAGRHRIRRLMRLMGVEATCRRPRTSVASPEHRVFPYLPRGLAISRADHVWCADITYVPVTQGFFYLVAVMDWATRHVLARCDPIRPSTGGRRARPTATARGHCDRCSPAPAGRRPRESAGTRSNAGSAHPGRLAPTAAKPRSPAGFPSRPPGPMLEAVLPLPVEDLRVEHPPRDNSRRRLPRALTTTRNPP